MLGGLLFGIVRTWQIFTLIPTLGMLAWFVDGYNRQNLLTPRFILVLFIVSVLACAWAVATLLRLGSTRRSAHFVAFIDLCFVGAFIAGVYELRAITKADCANFSSGSIYVNLGIFGYYARENPDQSQWALNVNKNCSMLKASFAFGIMNTIFFFWSSILAFLLQRHERDHRDRSRRSRHGSRRGHSSGSHHSRSRSRSRSRRYYL